MNTAGEIPVSTLGPFVHGARREPDSGRRAHDSLAAAGFRVIHAALADTCVDGLSVYHVPTVNP